MTGLSKKNLARILVFSAIIALLAGEYASVLIADSSQPKGTWAPNPVTISFPAAVGQGSNTASLTCNPSATGLQLVVTVSGNKLSLTATPSAIASCSSAPIVVTLTAKCLVSSSQCQGSYNGLVRLTRGSYYGDVPDNLKVNIITTGPPSILPASSTNTMFGLDSPTFYALVGGLVACIAAGGLLLGRKRLSSK